MPINRHSMDHEYIFIKGTDRDGNEREIVMKKHRGYGNHTHDYIGILENYGDSYQLHTHADDIIVVGRWWSRKRIGCINGEVGWVCKDTDFITYNLGKALFAPLNIALETGFQLIGDIEEDETIKGMNCEEVTAFITDDPPPLSQRVQRIFFGEVKDDSAPEENSDDDGTDDDYSGSSSSSNSYSSYSSSNSSSSSRDYDYSSSSTSSSSQTATTSTGSPSEDPGCFMILLLILGFFAIFIIATQDEKKASEKIEKKPANSYIHHPGTGNIIPYTATSDLETRHTESTTSNNHDENIVRLTPDNHLITDDYEDNNELEANTLDDMIRDLETPPEPPTMAEIDKFLWESEKPKTPPTMAEIDELLMSEERKIIDSERLLTEQESRRRRLNPATPEQAHRAETAGRDAWGRSPYER